MKYLLTLRYEIFNPLASSNSNKFSFINLILKPKQTVYMDEVYCSSLANIKILETNEIYFIIYID